MIDTRLPVLAGVVLLGGCWGSSAANDELLRLAAQVDEQAADIELLQAQLTQLSESLGVDTDTPSDVDLDDLADRVADLEGDALTEADLAGYATEAWVLALGYGPGDGSGGVTQTWVEAQGFATEDWVEAQGFGSGTGTGDTIPGCPPTSRSTPRPTA